MGVVACGSQEGLSLKDMSQLGRRKVKSGHEEKKEKKRDRAETPFEIKNRGRSSMKRQTRQSGTEPRESVSG